MAWKIDIFFIFLAQNPMYVDFNRATCIYMSFLTLAGIYGKNMYFLLWSEQKGEFESAY
jgi:hypothetical protein